MKLNLYFIQDYLHEPISAVSIHSPMHAGSLEGAVIYTPCHPVDPALLYLTDAQTWRACSGELREGCFVITGYDSSCPSRQDVDYIGLNSPLTPEELLVSVQEIFLRFHRWELALYDLMNRDAPLKEFGDITRQFVDNPICMYSAGLQIIFFSEDERPGGFRLFSDTKAMEFLTDEEIEGLRLNPDFVRTIDAVVPEIFPDDFWGYRILYDNIRSEGIYIARLMICEVTRPLLSSDHAILRRLAEFMQILVERRGISMNSHPKGFDIHISRLIDREPVSDAQLSGALQYFGWKPENTYFCAIIPVSEYDRAISTVTTFCTKLESLLPDSAALMRGAQVLLLVNLTGATSDRETILSHLVYLLRENLLKAGISQAFPNLWQLADYYDQAETALRLGGRYDPMLWSYRYENYAYRHLLHNALGGHSIESILPDGLQRLLAYDRLHNRQYTRSLKVYLEQNMSMTRTVRELYIQRSTFVYQLRRIHEISGLNLEEKNERIHLLLIFQIMEKEEYALP